MSYAAGVGLGGGLAFILVLYILLVIISRPGVFY
ncbi:sporulation protein YjcZ [Ammoniphilus sp. CFH 90114]|nr:sporulation protein YjcZ [Ammoniphilus sp. CFH 90114]RXT06354.1 sporulation protein YjcZ [Ammoniphilus sp. CFH 90114]